MADGHRSRRAANAWWVACRTSSRLVQQGELPAEKPDGKSYRLRRAAVEAWIERSRLRSGDAECIVDVTCRSL